MKTISGKVKLLAIAGVILVAGIVIQSCSKSSSPPSGPSVTSTTLASGATITAGTSTVITIDGTNLTGATVSTTASGITITNPTVTGGTSITATIGVAVSVASGSISLTITTPNGTTTATFTVVGLTILGGYYSSDSVAYSNLVTYFTFNGNTNDTVGGETTTAVGVTYIPGVRGMAYQGAVGAYVTAPATAGVQALASFSVSLWYNLPSAAKPQPSGGSPGGIFFVSGSNSGNDGDEIIIEADHPSPSQLAADSVPIHNGVSNIGSTTPYVGYVLSAFDTATSAWVHIVETYNDTTSTYTFYENGQPIADGSAFGDLTSTVLLNNSVANGGTPLGQLLWTPDPPANLFIGTWPPGLFGVSTTLEEKIKKTKKIIEKKK